LGVERIRYREFRLALREKVNAAYSEAAKHPEAAHAFPVGREFAESLGYPPELLAVLPRRATEAFTGVSAVSIKADIPTGVTVLDLGCGAGLDSLIAARRVGANGRVLGIDFSEAMLGRARCGAAESGVTNVRFCQAAAERLPIRDGSIDVALVNGIFNLNPARDAIFRELARVTRPGGVVYAAEIVLREPLPTEVVADETNWFA
jgi:SAM-dependent methyltransferase